ncbi:cell division protein SepF [Gorillibacterium massiliense]|uniref:cell division protein SepF n=1 Tax=Gorillibacterium massiliense TaxID=1280390 RepID=UPI0004B18633|nr:cell division protein SepF [Gorillibacterium massiliense]
MGVMNKFLNIIGLREEEDMPEDHRSVDEPEEIETNPFEQRKVKGNVVSIHSQKSVRVVLNEPRSYEDTQEIADHLRSRRPVIVNLQRVRPDQGKRIVDFLSGTVYALSGTISKIGPQIFLCTPDSVEIQGSIKEMMDDENSYN